MDQSQFRDRLLPGEKVMWSGQPQQGIRFTQRDVLLVPFSFMWGGFAIFWESSVLSMGKAPGFFALWGIPFVVAGLYFIFGRFLFDAWLRRGLAYAVTSQRVLIARPSPFQRFTALSLDRLPDVSLSEQSGMRGTITFGEASAYTRRGGFSGWSSALDTTPRFLGIENVQSVFDLIQSLAQKKAA